MLRALWFAAKLGLIVAAAVWIADKPGSVHVDWLGYDIEAQVGFVLVVLLGILVFALLLYRFLWGIFSAPELWRRYREQKKMAKGYRSLTLGLTAVAAGDTRLAGHHAARARKLLPHDGGLPVLLEAQAARLRGDGKKAHESFEALLANKDTSFMGLRGLMLTALEKGDMARASDITQRAISLYPRQPWILRMVYDMDLRQEKWDSALKALSKIEKRRALPPEKIKSDRAALLIALGDADMKAGFEARALERFKKAYAMDPAFVPAAVRLAQRYLGGKKRRAAISILEKTWRQNPHRDIVPLWRAAAPAGDKNSAVRMKWFERLVALRPDSAEGQMAAAASALDDHLWGIAQQYIERAGSIGANPRLYRLRARLAQSQNRPEETAMMLRRADDAPAEKTWICSLTGRAYEEWMPVAPPHGSFNTIVWDYPRPLPHAYVSGDASDILLAAPGK